MVSFSVSLNLLPEKEHILFFDSFFHMLQILQALQELTGCRIVQIVYIK